jgi:hypothetical protein
MNTPDDTQAPAAEPAITRPAAAPQRTKNQIRASATADGIAVKVKWKTLVTQARAQWEKVPAEDLLKVDGNFHKLAGLVQLRYQLSREESDQQVREFFDKHYAVA